MSNASTTPEEKLKLKDISASVIGAVPPEKKPLFDVPDQDWSEVEGIYQASAKGLVDIVNVIDHAIRKIKAQTEHTPSVELVVAINGISKDLEVFSKDMQYIHNSHKDKTGKISTDEDVQLSMKIVLDYNEFMERFRTTIMTPLAVISEELLKIEKPVIAQAEIPADTSSKEKQSGEEA